ncbi:MAG: thioredoxin reductase [Eubacteriales bacterium]|nr:thioredoxin reductase [Eubacteriales bacterium]MDN5364680.1 thioredoxin reductase [Eubacteriales bacterium]
MREEKIYDIAVVGCGPAGLSAAINARLRRKEVVVLGGEFCSTKLHKSPLINNYLGLPNVNGEELRQKFLEHARLLEVPIEMAVVEKIYPLREEFVLSTRQGAYSARSVILAIGSIQTNYLPGEEELVGQGISYCATCDGAYYQGKRVAVIAYDAGEGAEEANLLVDMAAETYYFPMEEGIHPVRREATVINQKPQAVQESDRGLLLRIEGGGNLEVDGIFIIRKFIPAEQLVPGLDTEGDVIRVDRHMQTNISGLFAAGDCTGRPWQLAKAVGEGQVAAISAIHYLDSLASKAYISNGDLLHSPRAR